MSVKVVDRTRHTSRIFAESHSLHFITVPPVSKTFILKNIDRFDEVCPFSERAAPILSFHIDVAGKFAAFAWLAASTKLLFSKLFQDFHHRSSRAAVKSKAYAIA